MLAEHTTDNGKLPILGIGRNTSAIILFDRAGAEVVRLSNTVTKDALIAAMNDVRSRDEAALARYAGSFGIAPDALLKATVEQLHADDAGIRDAAARALMEAGVAARILLRRVESVDADHRRVLTRMRRLLDSYHEETRARDLHRDVLFLLGHGAHERLKRILPDAPATNLAAWWKTNAARYLWSETHDKFVAR